jgi:hypothetical protein
MSLNPTLGYRVLIHWFCQEGIPFTPSQSLLDETLRFIAVAEHKKHALHTHWRLVKKKNLVWVEKII